MDYFRKRIIIADLDGTLSVSKSPIDGEMAALIMELLKSRSLAVISGGSYLQFQKQFLPSLPRNADLSRLYLFPTCATAFYKYDGNGWAEVYAERLSESERRKIFDAFDAALKETSFDFSQLSYGARIEDRDTQISFSALGQKCPYEIKSKWDPDHRKREVIVAALAPRIPEFEVRIGGTSTIDVTRKGIDKEYGINKISEYLGFTREEMLFVGDALFEGGNDYPAKKTGVDCMQVSGPEEAKALLRDVINTRRR